jgi:hypothetical protein
MSKRSGSEGLRGAAFPLGSLGESRGAGFRALGFVSTPGGLFRIELGVTHFPQGDSIAGSNWRGSWRTVSLAASLRPTVLRTESSRLRAAIGLAGHRTSITDVRNPYGTVPGVQIGFGIETSTGRAVLSLDSGLSIVLSDFGVDEFSGATFVPITLGITW